MQLDPVVAEEVEEGEGKEGIEEEGKRKGRRKQGQGEGKEEIEEGKRRKKIDKREEREIKKD